VGAASAAVTTTDSRTGAGARVTVASTPLVSGAPAAAKPVMVACARQPAHTPSKTKAPASSVSVVVIVVLFAPMSATGTRAIGAPEASTTRPRNGVCARPAAGSHSRQPIDERKDERRTTGSA
jgi:hypothetical protein